MSVAMKRSNLAIAQRSSDWSVGLLGAVTQRIRSFDLNQARRCWIDANVTRFCLEQDTTIRRCLGQSVPHVAANQGITPRSSKSWSVRRVAHRLHTELVRSKGGCVRLPVTE